MRRNRFLAILMFLLLSVSAIAQKKIEACESYDDKTGETSGVYTSWDASAKAPYVYYVFYNDGKKISEDVFLYVDKYNEKTKDYDIFDTKTMEVSDNKKWAMFDMEFTEGGKYKMSAANEDGDILASVINTINWSGEKGSSSSDNDNDNEEVDTYYYENSEILFCTSVSENGDPSGVAEEFTMARGASSIDVVTYVSNDKAFKTTKFYVDVYDSNSELVDTYEYEIEEDWDWSKFSITLKKRGDYTIDVYNAEDTFVNSATLKIK